MRGVTTTPAATALERTPVPFASSAVARTSPITHAFAIEYAAAPEPACIPATLEVVTMDPPRPLKHPAQRVFVGEDVRPEVQSKDLVQPTGRQPGDRRLVAPRRLRC
jgi:hypothetical protein